MFPRCQHNNDPDQELYDFSIFTVIELNGSKTKRERRITHWSLLQGMMMKEQEEKLRELAYIFTAKIGIDKVSLWVRTCSSGKASAFILYLYSLLWSNNSSPVNETLQPLFIHKSTQPFIASSHPKGKKSFNGKTAAWTKRVEILQRTKSFTLASSFLLHILVSTPRDFSRLCAVESATADDKRLFCERILLHRKNNWMNWVILSQIRLTDVKNESTLHTEWLCCCLHRV